MFFDHVYQAARLNDATEITPTLVKDVYQHSMLGIRGHVELSHMEERLKIALGPNLDSLALDLLTEAAVVGVLSLDSARVLAVEHFGEASPAWLRNIWASLNTMDT